MQFYTANFKKTKTGTSVKQWILTYKWILGGFVLGVIIFISGVIYLIHFSNIFKIKNIEVTGVSEYSARELTAGLKDYFSHQSKISAWLGAENILVWNNDLDDFFKSNPQFSNLNINSQYFSHKIFIIAEERKKFGLWCEEARPAIAPSSFPLIDQENSSSTDNINIYQDSLSQPESNCWWFDDGGIVFKQSASIDSEMFNRVSDLSDHQLRLGDKVLPDNLFKNLLKIFQIVNKIDLNAKTAYLKDLSLEEVYFESVSDPRILFSLRMDPEFTLSVMDTLKKSERWNKIDYIDFRVENKAYYRLK